MNARIHSALHTLRRIRGDQRGATIVEFAVIFPVFILAIFGIIETAIVLFVSSSIEAAVLEASRFGITGGLTPGVSREARVLDIVGDKTYGSWTWTSSESTRWSTRALTTSASPSPSRTRTSTSSTTRVSCLPT
jgi:Flp pilus assembly protein TadG